MANVALSWEQAGLLTTALAVGAAALTLCTSPAARRVAPFLREATIIAALYSLWQLAGRSSVLGAGGAFDRARWLQRAEHALHLPSEARVQDVVTANSVVAQAANIYYATMHFGGLFVFLLWLFVRHRDRYRPIRRVLAMTTFVCLVIALLPVAPPRLLPGYEDTAVKFGQSVYGFGFDADQLSAMPSVHVAWASLIAWAVWRVAAGPARWIGVAHLVLTVVVVVATANHFWADGVVAVAVLAVCVVLERAAVATLARLRAPGTDRELSAQPNSGILH